MYQALIDAVRLLRRRAAFSSAVVAIMALGIGSCTAIFSIIVAVLLAPWPYHEPDRLAIIWHAQGTAAGVVGMGPGDYVAYRDSSKAFEQIAAITTGGYNVGGEGAEPSRETCGRVTAAMFPMLSVNPSLGRWFTADEDRAASRVVMLSHDLWRGRFGGDASLPGRAIIIDAVPHTVVGIMPESFTLPPAGIQGTTEAACWLPAGFTHAEMITPSFSWVVLARRKPGVTAEQAADDAAAVARRIWESYPAAVQSQIQLRARLVPLAEQITAGTRAPLMMFAGSVLLLLLIGCANVSNLMLTRLQIRQREMTLRAALGATRGAIVKQLLAESLILSAVGSAAGIVLARIIMAATVAMSPGNVPRLDEAAINGWTLAFTITCAMLAGLAGGLAPAIRSRALSETGVRSSDQRTATIGFRRDRVRSALVVFEVAMAVVVLTMAALLARSVVNLNRVESGFDPQGVLTFSVALPEEAYPHADQIDTFARDVIERLRQVPTVLSAATGSSLPIGRADVAVVSLGAPAPGAPPYRPALMTAVTEHYHRAAGIEVTRGRPFGPADTRSAQPVAIVNEAMAKYWPDANAIGRAMQPFGDPRPLTVIGITADVRQGGLDRPPAPAFYVPMDQMSRPVRTLSFIMRSSGDPLVIAAHARQIIAEQDDTLPVFSLRTGADLMAPATAPRRFNLFMVSVFAVIAVALAVMGLYAVMAYTVSQSAKEFGIRLAIGSTSSGIVRLVLTRALMLLITGVILGAATAAAASRFIASLLFGVAHHDPGAYALAAVLLLGIGGLAVAIPARRAGLVDPIACLRSE